MNFSSRRDMTQVARRKPLRQNRRLNLDSLEQRIEPAPVNWVGGSGDWTVAANWSTNVVPGPGDEVVINTGGSATITIASGAQSVDSIAMTGNDHLAITGGSLTLTQASDINDLQMSGGAFTSNLLSTLTGTASLSNDASWFGLFRNEGTLTMTGDPNLTDVSLNNTGTILNAGARIDLGGNTTITNPVGGLFNITGTGDFGFLANAAGVNNLFHNQGTLQRSGTGTASFDGVEFVNDPSATIKLTTGSLLVNTIGTLASGPLLLSAGTTLKFDAATDLALSGSYTSTGAGHVDFTGGTFSLGASPVSFNFASGVATVSGSSTTFQNGTLNNLGSIRFADTSDPDFYTVILNNSGTILDGGRLDFGGDTTVNNLTGATFNITRNGTFDFLGVLAGANNLFHNSGTLRRSGTGTANFNGVPFANDSGAAIDITVGNLLLNTAGTLAAGPLSIATGSTLRFDTGTDLALSGSYTSTGAGHVDFNAGTFSLGFGTVSTNFASGVFTIAGGTTTIQNGTLNNTGVIRVADASDPNFDAVTLNNSGTILDGGRLDLGGDSTINNLAGATFDITLNGTSNFLGILSGANNLFHNAGTLRRSGTGTASFNGVQFQNDAGTLIDVTAGSLQLNTSGTLAGGSINATSGTSVTINGSNFATTGSFTGTGGGQLNLTGGTLTLGAGGASFNFPAGYFNWSGSAIVANGTLTNNGFIQLIGGTPRLSDATLDNAASIINSGARFDFAGTSVLNNLAGSTIDVTIAGPSDFTANLGGAGSIVHNAGTFRRNGVGVLSFGAIPFDSIGNVEVVSGTLNLNSPVTQVFGTTLTGGTWDVATGTSLLIPGTTLTTNAASVALHGTANAPAFNSLASNSGSFALLEGHDLAIGGDFTNSGTLTLSAGSVFSANGAFTQTSTGIIAFELGGTPASGLFGQVIATGAATLDGTASFSMNGYTAINGDAFTLMAFPSHVGTFATYNGIVPATGVFLTPTTTATQFGLNVLVDNLAPTSSVVPFANATTNRPVFQVSWGGSDGVGGTGIASYDAYVADNGGAYAPFLTGTTATSAVFTGQVGHSYDFYTRATDVVGNIENAPASADASIVVSRTLHAVVKSHTFTDADGDTYTVKLSGPGTLDAVLFDPNGDGHGPLDYLFANGTTTKSNITITVKKNKLGGDGIVTIGDVAGTGSLGTFSATASDLIMNGLSFTGAVKAIKVHDILRPEPALASPVLHTGGLVTDKLTISAHNIVDSTSIQTPGIIASLTAADIGVGAITAAGLNKLKTTAGGMDANLQIAGAIGPVTVKGPASGTWNATSFGAISVTGGNFDAQLTSTTLAATLGKKAALASLKISGGDFIGDVRVLGKAGAIKVSASKLGVGGNFNTGSINASNIASLTVGKNFVDSIVLAGADLGADHEFGGGIDIFEAGTIGAVSIGGNVTGTRSLIGAGFSRVGVTDTIIGGTTSVISSLKVTGTVDGSLHFAAGRFKAAPKIAGAAIDPTVDPRFLVA